MLLRSMSRPTLDASAISHKAPNIPPSVTSCMDSAISLAAAASLTMSISSSKPTALSTMLAGKCVINSSYFSFAKILVPSKPIALVITISIPGLIPPVDKSLSFLTFPTPVTDIRGWLTTLVTSV